jgi:hypothetical protein
MSVIIIPFAQGDHSHVIVDVLVPFLMSPNARTAMRTFSSWSSRESMSEDAEDDEDEASAIGVGDGSRSICRLIFSLPVAPVPGR